MTTTLPKHPPMDSRTGRRIVVVGAGAAGLATALSAARSGCRVTLLEKTREPGGIVAHGLIHTIGGLYDSRGALLNQGLPAELAERLARADPRTRPRKIGRVWVLNVSPAVYLDVVTRWLAEESRIHFVTEVSGVSVRTKGRRVASVEYEIGEGAGAGTTTVLDADALVDCTGEATVVRSIDEKLSFDDGRDALAGLIVRIRGVDPAELSFPKSVVILRRINAAIEEGILPRECSHLWIDTGIFEDEIYLKFSVAVSTAEGAAAHDSTFLGRIDGAKDKLVEFLLKMPEFPTARVEQTGRISLRSGGRFRGEYLLTGEDVRALRKFEDAACSCCWPIEYWDPQKGVQLEYLKPDDHYDIPLRSLKVAGFENLWSAGKCLSADYLAQASARVSGTCWAMGDAVGRAAALG